MNVSLGVSLECRSASRWGISDDECYPIQVIRCMNFLFAIKNESETAADPGDLGSVLISLQKLFGEGVKMI